MAISTTFQEIEKKFKSFKHKEWKSIEEYEEYYLRDLSERLADKNYYTDKEGVEREIPATNHFPELKEYEIWMEGYSITGQSEEAKMLGKVKARSFAQACHILMCKDHLDWMEKINQPTFKEFANPNRWDYDPSRLTYWGCGLYWSEKLARIGPK